MRRTFGLFVSMLAVAVLVPRAGRAADGDVTPDMLHASLGVGYHDDLAPIGARFWLPGQRMGIDLGFGYRADEVSLLDGRGFIATTYTVDLGVPLTLRRWNRLRFIARPGVRLDSEDQEIPIYDSSGIDLIRSDTARLNTFTFRGEIEIEYYLLDRLSVSAGSGAQFSLSKLNYPGATSRRASQSTSGNLMQLGFHLYLWNGR